MVSVAFKNRTRDEIIAAFRESIRKKQEWIKQCKAALGVFVAAENHAPAVAYCVCIQT